MTSKYRDHRYRIWYDNQHKLWLCEDIYLYLDYLPSGFVKILRDPNHGKRGPYKYYAKGKTPFEALWSMQKYKMKQKGETK